MHCILEPLHCGLKYARALFLARNFVATEDGPVATEMRTVLFIVLIHCKLMQCSLISQSVIQQCTVGDSSEPKAEDGKTCAKKFVVSVTLRGGQVYNYINCSYIHAVKNWCYTC